MYANCYGVEGIAQAIRILRAELIQDGRNLGINSLSDLSPKFVSGPLVTDPEIKTMWYLIIDIS